MKLKLLNSIKKNYSLISDKLPSVTTGKIEYDGQSIFLKKNGIPSTILIQYTGVVYFDNLMSPLVKVKFNKNAIFIINFFKIDFLEEIFSYSGDLKITNCKVMSFNQSSFYPTIVDKIGDDKANTTSTKFEDDGMVLFDIERGAAGKSYRGASKPSIPSNRFDEYGNIQKYGKVERQEIATAAFQTASVISRPKPAVTKSDSSNNSKGLL